MDDIILKLLVYFIYVLLIFLLLSRYTDTLNILIKIFGNSNYIYLFGTGTNTGSFGMELKKLQVYCLFGPPSSKEVAYKYLNVIDLLMGTYF